MPKCRVHYSFEEAEKYRILLQQVLEEVNNLIFYDFHPFNAGTGPPTNNGGTLFEDPDDEL